MSSNDYSDMHLTAQLCKTQEVAANESAEKQDGKNGCYKDCLVQHYFNLLTKGYFQVWPCSHSGIPRAQISDAGYQPQFA